MLEHQLYMDTHFNDNLMHIETGPRGGPSIQSKAKKNERTNITSQCVRYSVRIINYIMVFVVVCRMDIYTKLIEFQGNWTMVVPILRCVNISYINGRIGTSFIFTHSFVCVVFTCLFSIMLTVYTRNNNSAFLFSFFFIINNTLPT